MKVWTWLLPNEMPSTNAINLLVGHNYHIIEIYKELSVDQLIDWLLANVSDNVLLAPILNNKPAESEYFIYIYFKNKNDASHFKLRWQ